MSNQRRDGLDRPIGEQWVELSRDEKTKICNALIDRNQPDVVEEFASLVRFTRGYLHQQPTGSFASPGETTSVPTVSTSGAQPPGSGAAKRKNDGVPMDSSNTPVQKARKVAIKNDNLIQSKWTSSSEDDDDFPIRRMTKSRTMSVATASSSKTDPRKGDVQKKDESMK